jgi:hypothetical protein
MQLVSGEVWPASWSMKDRVRGGFDAEMLQWNPHVLLRV